MVKPTNLVRQNSRGMTVGLGAGFDLMVELSRDLRARPHDRATRDRLMMEVLDNASLLVTISNEDEDAWFLAEVIALMVRAVVDAREVAKCPIL